jgi:Ni,Fe-hydrogenase I cytochrome b subunit
VLYAVVNIWVDVIGHIVILGMLGVLVVWFSGTVITGRFTEKFIRKHWAFLDHLHEPLGHEFPIPIRIWHWTNLISFIVFFASGLYIRYPYFYGGMDVMKKLHYFFMYVAAIAFVLRLSWTLSTDDRKNFKFYKDEISLLWEVPMYYLFIRPGYPHIHKFHPMQRGTYWTMALLFPIQAYTGFSLMWPQQLLGFISGPFGGVAAAAAWMRLTHSVIMRIYLVLVLLHAYLAIVEAWPKLKCMWFWIEPEIPHLDEKYKRKVGVSEDYRRSSHGSSHH